MELIDTHAHLDFPRFNEDRKQVMEKARKEDVNYIINVASNLAASHRGLELSQIFSSIYATVGVHPHDADQVDKEAISVLKDMAKADQVVAIGEIGLDFHYDNSPRDKQKEVFRAQLDLAREINLPVVIHSREAEEETLKILIEKKVSELGGIFHCFTGDLELAERVMDLGLYLALGGIITFNNADNLRRTVSDIPLKKILLETDCPFLTPHPYRGQRNEPSYVKYVAEKIAEIKDISLSEVAKRTTENAKKVYRL